MTTLRKLSAQIIRLLSAGTRTKDSKLSDKYIQEECRQVIHKLVKAEYYVMKKDTPSSFVSGDYPVNHLCIATYTGVQVNTDSVRNRCYANLPAYPMNLPGGIGIQSVTPETGDYDVSMVPIMPEELELFRSLNAGLEIMKDQWCWEPDRDKIWFTERNNKTLEDEGVDTVQVRMVVYDPVQIGEDDPLPIPPEMETDVIQQVLVLHGYTGHEVADMVNDGNPNNK